jgi:hypothetical protein
MSLARTSIDRITLPQAMLPLTKAHLRVSFDDDDQIIVHKLTSAISLFEMLTQFSVSQAVYAWTPGIVAPLDSTGLPADAGKLPVMRVGSFTAKDSVNVDVTPQYSIYGDTLPDSIAPQYLIGPSGSNSGPTVSLTVGFPTMGDMPPTIIDIAMRIAGYLYEWREVQNVPGVDGVAYANSLLTNWWIPRA